MNDTDNIALIEQVMSLARTLIELKDTDAQLSASSPKDYPGFVHVGVYNRSAEAAYYMNPITGQVLYNTWSISGHNGSSYGDEYKMLSAEDATRALRGMCSSFISRGVAIEKELKQKELRRNEDDELRDRFLSRVKQ